MGAPRDHGGGLDAAALRHGGARADWLDLSTGINPVPYPVPPLPSGAWTALPDSGASAELEQAARRFWQVPEEAGIAAAPGASALIAQIPALRPPGAVDIPQPTYNEHAAAFTAHGWNVNVDLSAGAASKAATGAARVLVHPNNPTGHWYTEPDLTAPFTVIDESFADTDPARSLIAQAGPGRIVLKSFGKFWGLAGLRLGFAIGAPQDMAALRARLGPWAVSGPALTIGAAALSDPAWAQTTRTRLTADSARLDSLMAGHGASIEGGTPLFRLYRVDDAAAWQDRLARAHIWTRIFPYSAHFVRLGLPAPGDWARLEAAL